MHHKCTCTVPLGVVYSYGVRTLQVWKYGNSMEYRYEYEYGYRKIRIRRKGHLPRMENVGLVGNISIIFAQHTCLSIVYI